MSPRWDVRIREAQLNSKKTDWARKYAQILIDLPRPVKRLITLCVDMIAIPAALLGASLLKHGLTGPQVDWRAYLVVLAVSIPVFARCGLYRAVIRFLGHRALFAVVLAVSLSSGLLGIIVEMARFDGLTPSVVLIYACLAFIYVGGSRVLARYYLLTRYLQPTVSRVAIYGAGDAGARLCATLSTTRAFDPVAFIDDNRALQGSSVNGIRVYSPEKLPRLIQEFSIDRVLLALPSESRRRRREILNRLEPLKVHIQTVPEIEHLVSGEAQVSDLREIDVADLLGRDTVPPNARLLEACIRSRVVMVTGAGGSIGSELCRQIVQQRPSRLLLFEMSELALYNIERELRLIIRQNDLDVDLVPVIGNAHHKFRLRDILQAYRVQTVYHAAAYKHVPIVEQNIIEGIHNNVISTWYAAEAAQEAEVETFVLISTDKAVNPTNVMGATKRLAEMVLQGLQQRRGKTRFCMVRFGNVLASSGSVVPLFYEQIRSGGPITVTHPDVIRYFMTIPEAAQLVIQAGSMANGGDVFVLDMGKPVRIDDLARRMVHLMGMSVRDENNPDGDIEIAYTGLRPAEKLFEELLIGNNVTGTEHPMILRAIEHCLPWEKVAGLLDNLLTSMSRFDCARALELLQQSVVEYKPAPEIHDLVWARQSENLAEQRKVTDLKTRRLIRQPAPSDFLRP